MKKQDVLRDVNFLFQISAFIKESLELDEKGCALDYIYYDRDTKKELNIFRFSVDHAYRHLEEKIKDTFHRYGLNDSVVQIQFEDVFLSKALEERSWDIDRMLFQASKVSDAPKGGIVCVPTVETLNDQKTGIINFQFNDEADCIKARAYFESAIDKFNVCSQMKEVVPFKVHCTTERMLSLWD